MWLLSKRGIDFSEPATFQQFYAQAIQEPFFMYMRDRDHCINATQWRENCSDFSVAGVFEGLMKFYCDVQPGGIWGDKSPSNTKHIDLIKDAFPTAKFIHIVRDARDCCASARKAWKSNLYRNAQRWTECVRSADESAKRFPDDYHLIKYEDLIDAPENEIRRACEFLKVPFDSKMLRLEVAPEQVGSAAGSTKIVSGNSQKYKSTLSSREIQNIEKIAVECLGRFGYPCSYSGPAQQLTSFQLKLYRLSDGMRHIVRNTREKGLYKSLVFTWKFFRMNSKIKN
jgi:hypothetical protein